MENKFIIPFANFFGIIKINVYKISANKYGYMV